MEIEIKNCNNIANGKIEIVEGALNVKYAINGTGKSTIAKAISFTNDQNKLTELRPYQYLNNAAMGVPQVNGLRENYSVLTFDEAYIEQYVLRPDELMKNTFEVFIKTPSYDEHMKNIESMLKKLHETFQTHEELNNLIDRFKEFQQGFGKAKSGYSKSSPLVKGLVEGNKIDNIPSELMGYKPYLENRKDGANIKWLKWQNEGQRYLEVTDKCPYCLASIQESKDQIQKLAQSYEPKNVEHLEKMISIFEDLQDYFGKETRERINEIFDKGLNKGYINYLLEIKKEAENLEEALEKIKNVGFYDLRNIDNIYKALQDAKIDIRLYHHFNSEVMNEKIDIINEAIKDVEKQAGILKGEVAKQKKDIEKIINENQNLINDFLACAGYSYTISIEHRNKDNYYICLKPKGIEYEVTNASEHLSYGERNALALALFMFDAIRQNPDLVILDDPISSFDGNKKFALLNMLFLSKKCLKNRTVLLLTHDFNTLIDIIHTLPFDFNPNPHGYFLTNKSGNLVEKKIRRDDIVSFLTIVERNCGEDIPMINKLIYLRRLFEIRDKNGAAWNILSSLFHKKEKPDRSENKKIIELTAKELEQGNNEIKKYISNFNYDEELKQIQDEKRMLTLYNKSKTNYEKIQLYRIINNDNNKNKVIRKFVNEVFHVENDNIFQLNPLDYDTVPDYVIEECTKDLKDKLNYD